MSWLLIRSHTFGPVACSLSLSRKIYQSVSLSAFSCIKVVTIISSSTVSILSFITYWDRYVKHLKCQNFSCIISWIKLLPQPGKLPATQLLSTSLYMFTICSLYVHYKFTISSLYVHYMFTIRSLYVHYLFTICSLYIHYMFIIYSLYVHYIFTIYNIQPGKTSTSAG